MRWRAGTKISLFLALLLAASPVPADSAGDPPSIHGLAAKDLTNAELTQALEKLQKAYDLFTSDAKLRNQLADVYAQLGRNQLNQRQYEEAAASFDRARELLPDNAGFHLGRGIALYGGKHYDDALFELEQAKLYGGDEVMVLFFQGRVYYDTGNLEGALEVWRKGLALDPANGELSALIEKTGREATVEARKSKETSSRFTISYDVATEMRLADEALDILDTAYNRIGSDFDHYPATRIPVILYTRQEFRATTAGPDWSDGIFDGKIRLPIGGIREITPQLRAVLFHEYTHVVVRELTRGNCPTWLNEGLAVLEERREYAPHAVKPSKGEPLSLSVLEGSFLSLGTIEAALAYWQSFAMVDYLVSTYGWHKVREILVNLGKGLRMETAVSRAFSDYGLDYDALIQELQKHMQKE